MQPREAYDLCCRHMGKRVCITEKCGRKHYGTITRVDRDMVWIMPNRGFGGFGLGFWGFGGGGLGIGIAIGAIAGIALAGAFRW
ncbi:hypothetical protein [Lysinibacillus sp. SGAir0095]|uniref:hypothetical protein n=1 Tax=Lysinibacillus sp. SGAir0095 TaxID=2070463 RepID=UPI0010CD1DC0|nr:hypothetical protein [Lysinibacillus sp. SGAir0095]QCR34097.1 hypothetical protein C1N55_19080 [Lysinibacillus sp. SGAir0095]